MTPITAALARTLPLACAVVAASLSTPSSAQTAADSSQHEGRGGWLGIRVGAGALALGGMEDSVVLIVADVYPDGPAAVGGVLPGDRVLAVDGVEFAGWGRWVRLTAGIAPGRALRMRLLGRDGGVREATVVAGEPPSRTLGFAPSGLPYDQRAQDEFAAIQLRLLRTMDSLLRVAASPAGDLRRARSRTRSFDLLAGGRRGDSAVQAVVRQAQDELRSPPEPVRIGADGYATPPDGYATPPDGGGGPVLGPVVRSEASWQLRLMTPALLDNPFVFGGARARNLSGELARYFDGAHGVLLTAVFPRTPAAAAGFQPGDVIVAVGGQETPALTTLRTVLAGTGPPYEVTVVRQGQRATVWYPEAPAALRRQP